MTTKEINEKNEVSEIKKQKPAYVATIEVPMWRKVDKNNKIYYTAKLFGVYLNFFEPFEKNGKVA